MAFERIELNICPAGDMPVFHCSQYDTGRPIIIDLLNGDDAFTPTAGTTFELHCRKVDDNIVTLDTYEVDGNTLTFTSTEQLCACPGDNLCEVAIYLDESCMGTLNFMLHVEPDPLAGGLESETQIYNLTEQVEEITEQVIGDNYYDKTEVDDLLDAKADAATTYTKTEVDTALNLKADKSDTYTKTETNNLLAGKADASDTYSKAQVDSKLSLKADKATTYTKTQVDNALALKANSADLATVATTGDYDDLLNKPTIPDAQVQSDYAQTDNTQVDYIKNKPDIEGMIADAILEVMPVDTASGPIATFDTELAVPLVNVSCDVVATGGNGTPDNPIPINGYTEANITRCGVNLWDGEIRNGYYISSTGVFASYGNMIANVTPIKVIPNSTIYIASGTYNISVSEYDANMSFIRQSAGKKNETLTLSATTAYINFSNTWNAGSAYNNDISINYPSTDTAYHAYNGQTYAISFGQTVYGGVLDVTRGKLTVTHANIASYNGESINEPWLSSMDTYVPNTTPTTGAQVVYPLTTPFDIDLTPVQINAIIGTNNVYSDTNGNTTVQFKDSIQHYIDTKVGS